jgi:hypothetical protein
MWRWLIIVTFAGCVYHPQKLTSAGDADAGDSTVAGDATLPRFDTWTDLGNSSVGPRDAPLHSSASGSGVSSSTVGAYLPAVAATDTAIVVAWQESVGGQPSVRVLRFADNVWSSYDGSTDGFVANGKQPSLALESDGTPVVAFESGDSIAVVRHSGSSWPPYGDSLLITDPLAEAASQPSLAIGPVGAVVAYRTGVASETPTTSDSVRVRRHDNGWTNMAGTGLEVSASNTGSNPDLALMPSGAPVVVWDADTNADGAREVHLRRLENDGTWAPVVTTTVSNGTGSASEPAVAINPGGRIGVTWLDTTPGYAAVYLEVYDNGGTWYQLNSSATGDGVSKTEPTRPASAPDVAFPGDQNFESPIVTYVSHDSGPSTVHVRMPGRNGVLGWVGPTHPFYPSDGTISWPGDSCYTPAIALIPTTGRPVVAWNNYNGSGVSQIYVKRYTCLTMWEELVEGAATGVSEAPTCAEASSLQMNANAEPTVAWQTWTLDNSNWEIYLRAWVGHHWSPLGRSTTDGGISNTTDAWWDSGWPSLALGGNGKPWVAWAEFMMLPPSEYWTVYLRAYESGAWEEKNGSGSGSGIPYDGPSQFPSLTIGANDTPWVAWLYGARDLRLAQWTGTSWTEIGGPVADPALGPVGRPSLAVDSTGAPVVAWFRRNDSNGHMNVYVHRYKDGNWSSIEGDGVVAGGAIWASNPSLAIDRSDFPVVAYQEQATQSGPTWGVFVSRWDGSSWQRVGGGGLSTGPRESREPSLALDSGGQPVVAWTEATDRNFEIYLRHYDGSSWAQLDGSATTGGVSKTNTDSRYPSLDIARDRACVSWTDAGPSGLQIAVRCIDLPLR